MEIIRRVFKPDIIVIAEEEMDSVDWGKIKCGCIYLDIWGNFHFELNHRGFYNHPLNTNWLHLFIQQEKMYQKLPLRLLKTCKAKPVSDLIGVRQFLYLRKPRLIMPANVGILPWEYMKGRGDEERNPYVGDFRKMAYTALFDKLDDVAVRLGAKAGYFPTAVISEEKMKEYGCFPHKVTGFREHLFKWMMTFPARNQKVYIKIYSEF